MNDGTGITRDISTSEMFFKTERRALDRGYDRLLLYFAQQTFQCEQTERPIERFTETKMRVKTSAIYWAVLTVLIVTWLIAVPLNPDLAVAAQAGQIEAISPTSGRSGDRVTISGQGFGAQNINISVGGVPAQVLSATGNQATFIVPGGLKPGVTTVTATNPGGHTGSIAFQILPSTPLARIDGDRVVFESAPGVITQIIPLVNQTIQDGDLTVTTTEEAIISDDLSLVGVFSYKFTTPSLIDESEVSSTFRFYNASGLQWQQHAPKDSVFLESQPRTKRLLSSDGQRVVLIAVQPGGGVPLVSVFNATGSLIYQWPQHYFADFLKAEISPNGKYLIIVGILVKELGANDAVTVVDVDSGLSSGILYDLPQDGPVMIALNVDGRFLVSSDTFNTVLPVQ